MHSGTAVTATHCYPRLSDPCVHGRMAAQRYVALAPVFQASIDDYGWVTEPPACAEESVIRVRMHAHAGACTHSCMRASEEGGLTARSWSGHKDASCVQGST